MALEHEPPALAVAAREAPGRTEENTVINLTTEVDLDDLAEKIAGSSADRDELIKFILRIDELTADYDFTKTLAQRLQAAVDAEDAD